MLFAILKEKMSHNRCAMLIFSVKMTIHEEMPIGWGILEICKEE